MGSVTTWYSHLTSGKLQNRVGLEQAHCLSHTNLGLTEGSGQLSLPRFCYRPAAKAGAQTRGSFPCAGLPRSLPLSLSFCHICYTSGMLQFHGPGHTWGSAHLISPRCVCSQNRESIIPISILTNKACPKAHDS